jgi:Fibronectin type III domain
MGTALVAGLLAVSLAGVAAVATAPVAGAAVSKPNAPTGLSTLPSGSTGVEFLWTPGNNGHSTVDHYTISYYLGGVYKGIWATIPEFPHITTLTGFSTGASYQFTISAHNSLGDGPQSAKSAAVRVGSPSPPTCCSSAIRVAAGAVKLKFAKPPANGAPITKYTATCRSSNHGVLKSKTGTVTLITVTGLTPGKNYVCQVTATNSRGTGPASRPTNRVKA